MFNNSAAAASAEAFSSQPMNTLNFDSKRFLEEEFNKSKYLTTAANKSTQRRISMLSPETRMKLLKQGPAKEAKRGCSTFLSNCRDLQEEDDFNSTLNLIVRKNVDFWQDFARQQRDIECEKLNQLIEKRQQLKRRFLGKILLPEKKDSSKAYMDLMETVGSISTSLPKSKVQSRFL
jgi:mRNA deadenylase 3'-5' endonuclease subunit Ccr4